MAKKGLGRIEVVKAEEVEAGDSIPSPEIISSLWKSRWYEPRNLLKVSEFKAF